jgi:DNA-binding IclR family transcriptional regulator
MTSIRFPVDPRDVPAVKAARRMGLTEAEFHELRDRLFARGFPRPDPDTGLYDLKAIDDWMDRRSGLTKLATARDAADVVSRRLEALRERGKAR